MSSFASIQCNYSGFDYYMQPIDAQRVKSSGQAIFMIRNRHYYFFVIRDFHYTILINFAITITNFEFSIYN